MYIKLLWFNSVIWHNLCALEKLWASAFLKWCTHKAAWLYDLFWEQYNSFTGNRPSESHKDSNLCWLFYQLSWWAGSIWTVLSLALTFCRRSPWNFCVRMKECSDIILLGIFYNNSNFQLFCCSFGSNYCALLNIPLSLDDIYPTPLGNYYLIFSRASNFYYKKAISSSFQRL